MKKEIIGLALVVSIILIIVLSFILYNEWPLLTGKKIVLATRPVDPFDLFRGQYMSIRYEISTLNNAEGFEAGDSIYVILKKDKEGVWRMQSTSREKPEREDFIKGKIKRVYGNTANVEYGIEQFFFERGAELPTRNITVEVSVANSGRARLVQLLHNGEPATIKYKPFDIKA